MPAATWYHIVGINPEPWKTPDFALVRGRPMTFKHEGLKAYQAAIKDAMATCALVTDERIALTFLFWRRLDLHTHDDKKKRNRGHKVDATNMQKALEDALQGVLFKNDRDVMDVRSVIIAQGPDVEPRICIRVLPHVEFVDPLKDMPAPINETVAPEPDLFDVEELF